MRTRRTLTHGRSLCPAALATIFGSCCIAATALGQVSADNTGDASASYTAEQDTTAVSAAQKLLGTRPIYKIVAPSQSVMVIAGNATDLGLSGKFQLALSDPVLTDPKLPGRVGITALYVDFLIPQTEPVSPEKSRYTLNKTRASNGWLNSDGTFELDLYLVAPDGAALAMPIQLGGYVREDLIETIGCMPPNDKGEDLCLFIKAALSSTVDDGMHHVPTPLPPILVSCEGPAVEFVLDETKSSMSLSNFIGTAEYSLTGSIQLTMAKTAIGPCVRFSSAKFMAVDKAAFAPRSDDDTLNATDPAPMLLVNDPKEYCSTVFNPETGDISIELHLVAADDITATTRTLHLAGVLQDGRLFLAGDNGPVADATMHMTLSASLQRNTDPLAAKSATVAKK